MIVLFTNNIFYSQKQFVVCPFLFCNCSLIKLNFLASHPPFLPAYIIFGKSVLSYLLFQTLIFLLLPLAKCLFLPITKSFYLIFRYLASADFCLITLPKNETVCLLKSLKVAIFKQNCRIMFHHEFFILMRTRWIFNQGPGNGNVFIMWFLIWSKKESLVGSLTPA